MMAVALNAVLGRLARTAATFAITGVLAWAGVLLAPDGSRVASLWLANAVVVALLLRSDRSRWAELLVAAFLGNSAANLWNGDPPLQALILAALNSSEVLLVAVPFRSRFDPAIGLADIRTLGSFLLWAGLVAPALTAASAAAYLSPGDPGVAGGLFGRWFIGDALGLLTLTPLLLALPRRREEFPARREMLETSAILLFILLVSLLVFSQSVSLLYALLACLMLASFRLGIGGAATATTLVALVATIATIATIAGHGPIAAEPTDPARQMLILQSFIAVALVTVPISAIIGERDRLEAAARRTRGAIAERAGSERGATREIA